MTNQRANRLMLFILAMALGADCASLPSNALAAMQPESRCTSLATDMRGRWPKATYVEDSAATHPYAQRVFDPT